MRGSHGRGLTMTEGFKAFLEETKALRASIHLYPENCICRFCGSYAQCAYRPISQARSERDDDATICLDCTARAFWLFARVNPAIADLDRARAELDGLARSAIESSGEPRIVRDERQLERTFGHRSRELHPEARRALDSATMADEPNKCGCAQADCPECSR